MFRIVEATQPYAWGSSSALQELFGGTGATVAEAWLGAHCSAPSLILDDEDRRSLVDLVAAAPEAALGPDVVARFGPQLPYLLKVLAAEHPLSLQVHPHIDRARAGFDEEDAVGVPLEAPHRNYKDRNHKPELVFALTQFEAMCGFRAPLAWLVIGQEARVPRRRDGRSASAVDSGRQRVSWPDSLEPTEVGLPQTVRKVERRRPH